MTKDHSINKDDMITLAEQFINDSPNNYISEEIALHPNCVSMKIYESPIFAFGSPHDELYTTYKSPDVIGSHFLSPPEWLPDAKTVISFFLPYTEQIKAANAIDRYQPANQWLHGRYEGQILLSQLLEHLIATLSEAGFQSLAPSLDPRCNMGNPEENFRFASNWSERHVAYACGLGTFGLSRGIITKKGMSGRLGSILTTLDLPKDNRDYDETYAYCNMCGICIVNCPAQAISYESGMEHILCSNLLDKTRAKHAPRYGCGKCQVSVPCESKIPMK